MWAFEAAMRDLFFIFMNWQVPGPVLKCAAVRRSLPYNELRCGLSDLFPLQGAKWHAIGSLRYH
jgi:hypothetical protein